MDEVCQISEELISAMEQEREQIGSVFVRMSKVLLEVYTAYCKNHNLATLALKKVCPQHSQHPIYTHTYTHKGIHTHTHMHSFTHSYINTHAHTSTHTHPFLLPRPHLRSTWKTLPLQPSCRSAWRWCEARPPLGTLALCSSNLSRGSCATTSSSHS